MLHNVYKRLYNFFKINLNQQSFILNDNILKSLELDELNFGPKHKKTLNTKETLEKLKK